MDPTLVKYMSMQHVCVDSLVIGLSSPCYHTLASIMLVCVRVRMFVYKVMSETHESAVAAMCLHCFQTNTFACGSCSH